MKKYVLSLISILLISSCSSKEDSLSIINYSSNANNSSTNFDSSLKVDDIENYNDIAHIIVNKINNLDSYVLESKGTSTANSIIKYTQQIEAKTIKKNEYYYVMSNSSSSLVKQHHEAFYKDNMVVYDDNNLESKDNYNNKFGYTPFDNNLCGFIINENTIISSLLEKNEDNYIYNLSLNDKAGDYLRIQMKTFATLKEYPTFNSINLIIDLDNDFNVSTILLEANYNIYIKVIGKTTCNEILNYKFLLINEDVSIPNEDKYLSLIEGK